jgi:hypothetical protein
VRVRYRPTKSTCPKSMDDDGCEYFDVAADVFVTVSTQPAQKFSAKGSCGC